MPRRGEWVGRYELVRVLGQGGMGQVWLARGQEIAGTRRNFAVKFFSFDEEGDDLETFLGEARIAMLLSHSNIVQVFDAGECESGRFLAMEWVEGLDLGKILRAQWKAGHPIDLGAAMFIVAQVLRALHYAYGLRHEGRPLRVVHRDVSPQNVLISISGEVKLVDFGIARSAIHSTAGTHIKGKLHYMAPEQLQGEPLTQAADLYAVGVIMHELSGQGRFRRGRSDTELWQEIMLAEIPALPEALPPELEQVRQRLLARDPRDRFASAEEALRALQSWPSFRDCTFAVAELCERWMPAAADRGPIPRTEVAAAPERAAARGVETPASAREQPVIAIDPRAIAEATDERAPRRWPLAAVGIAAAIVGVLGGWYAWTRAEAPDVPAHAGEPVVVAAAPSPDADANPRADDAAPEERLDIAAPASPASETPAPVGVDVNAEAEAPRVDAEPHDARPRNRRRRSSAEPKPSPPVRSETPDKDVLASVRGAARRACRDSDGKDRIEIDFLIEADGRPALLRSSAPGDPRSACIEKKLRGARFAAGSSRRASLGVTFDPS